MTRSRRRVRFVQVLAISAAMWLLAPTAATAHTETVEYYATDAIGSIRVVFNASGSVIGRMDYSPFGEELYKGLLMPKERFAELDRDGEAGVDYAEARMYQPRTGRFSRPDPVFAGLFNPQAWNRYTYAASNPATNVDPSGLFWMCLSCLSGATAQQGNNSGTSSAESGVAAGEEGMLSIDVIHDAEARGFWDWVKNWDNIQSGLDVLSVTLDGTVVGGSVSWIPDVINGGISLGRGDWSGAALSGAAMLPYLGAGANLTRIGRHTYTQTVANHAFDLTKHGDVARPYLNSPLVIEQIMKAGTPVPDPGGVKGALRWDVPGSFNGTRGTGPDPNRWTGWLTLVCLVFLLRHTQG